MNENQQFLFVESVIELAATVISQAKKSHCVYLYLDPYGIPAVASGPRDYSRYGKRQIETLGGSHLKELWKGNTSRRMVRKPDDLTIRVLVQTLWKSGASVRMRHSVPLSTLPRFLWGHGFGHMVVRVPMGSAQRMAPSEKRRSGVL